MYLKGEGERTEVVPRCIGVCLCLLSRSSFALLFAGCKSSSSNSPAAGEYYSIDYCSLASFPSKRPSWVKNYISQSDTDNCRGHTF